MGRAPLMAEISGLLFGAVSDNSELRTLVSEKSFFSCFFFNQYFDESPRSREIGE